MANLKVAVRVRPMSEREIDIGAVPTLSVENGTIAVTNIKVPEHHAGDSRERIRKFYFDYCFDENSSQDQVFSMIENEISTALRNRYHACVLAYGQSSTGKTYTMLGNQDDPGITPRLCENIFKYFQLDDCSDESKSTRIYVSYLEIYNERVLDLLSSTNSNKNLKVREHPKRGPYVQGLSEHEVTTPESLLTWLRTGNAARRVAATPNNRRSSRSHCVFSVFAAGSRTSTRLHLVDLAGSERAHHKAAYSLNTRLKEGANINRSLVALGNVICALADQVIKGKKSRRRFVPYRDSVLTWLLKETLGGNSKTVMIATISPSSTSYNETVNTLRFGQRAQQIVNQPLVNEDAQERLIRELRDEIARLKQLLASQTISTDTKLHYHPQPTEVIDMSEMTEETNSIVSQSSSKQRQSLDGLTLKLLPVELITNEEPPKIIEFNPETPKSVSLEELLNFEENHYSEDLKEDEEVSKDPKEDICDDNNIPLLLTNLGTFGSKKCTNKLHFKPEAVKLPKSPDHAAKEVISLSPIGEASILTEENDLQSLEEIDLEEKFKVVEEESHPRNSNSLEHEDELTLEENNTLNSIETAENSEEHIDSLTDLLSSATVSDDVIDELLKGFAHVNGSTKDQVNTLAKILHAVVTIPEAKHLGDKTKEQSSSDTHNQPDSSEDNPKDKLENQIDANPEPIEAVDKDHHEDIIEALSKLLGVHLETQENLDTKEEKCQEDHHDGISTVKELLDKALAESKNLANHCSQGSKCTECKEIEELKKDTLHLVNNLMKKVEDISKTKTENSEEAINQELGEPEKLEETPEENQELTETSQDREPTVSQTAEAEDSSRKEKNLPPKIDEPQPKTQPKKKLSRTNSEEGAKPTIRRSGKEFGSHEALSRRSSLLTKNAKLSSSNRSFIRNLDTSANPSRSGSLSDASGVSTPKKSTSGSRRPTPKRSEVVQQVTKRLYNQRKAEDDKHSALEAAKMFTAKLRLQDLTQRALRAKRKVHVDTQTEDQSTIRMKEKSTDVQDIGLVNMVVKDAVVEAFAETTNTGVTCHIQNSTQSLKLTGTSSTQTEEMIKPSQAVSFTKYLQNPPRAPYSQPIYTSSVNINVQHNYGQGKEVQSDDSLDENGGANVHFSTPDLISNHNSLEQVESSSCTTQEQVESGPNKEKFFLNECFATSKQFCVAKSSVEPGKNTLSGVSQPVTRSPEICSKDPFIETCKPFEINLPKEEVAHPVTNFEGFQQIKMTKTGIRSNVPKGSRKSCVYSSDEEESGDECCGHKKVRFRHKRNMLDVVTNFIDEASSLLFKLNNVANQVERRTPPRLIFPRFRRGKECFIQTELPSHDACSQTSSTGEVSSTQTPTWPTETTSKEIQTLVEPSKTPPIQEEIEKDDDSDSDYFNVETTGTNWKFCSGDYNSLDTVRSTSDYGSLPYRGKNKRNLYSPKAYMQQLVAMRKKIVEDERMDILKDEFKRLPSPELY